jgi:hypothetical protein
MEPITNKSILETIMKARERGDTEAFFGAIAEDALLVVTGMNLWSRTVRVKHLVAKFYA